MSKSQSTKQWAIECVGILTATFALSFAACFGGALGILAAEWLL